MTAINPTNPYGDVRFLYVRDAYRVHSVKGKATVELANQGTTFAYRFNDATENIEFAVAKCSDKDRFVKKIGRELAFARLYVSGTPGNLPYRLFQDKKPSFKSIAGFLKALS